MKSSPHAAILATLLVAALSLAGYAVAAPPAIMPNPDFTKGEQVPEGADKDSNLEATGARGWIYTRGGGTFEARQVLITRVAAGSLADGTLIAGLDLFSKHHVSEGIGLIADYVRL